MLLLFITHNTATPYDTRLIFACAYDVCVEQKGKQKKLLTCSNKQFIVSTVT